MTDGEGNAFRRALPASGECSIPFILTISGPKDIVPKSICNAEIHTREPMMNRMMLPKVPVPGAIQVRVMVMDMVKGSVNDKARNQACHKAQ